MLSDTDSEDEPFADIQDSKTPQPKLKKASSFYQRRNTMFGLNTVKNNVERESGIFSLVEDFDALQQVHYGEDGPPSISSEISEGEQMDQVNPNDIHMKGRPAQNVNMEQPKVQKHDIEEN